MLRMADSSHVSEKIFNELARYMKIYKKGFVKKSSMVLGLATLVC